MQYKPLHSSWLKAAAYEPLTGILTVSFQNGRAWRYRRVPAYVYEGLLTAESAGEYFNRWIRDRGYQSIEVPRPASQPQVQTAAHSSEGETPSADSPRG